jgi:peptide/nickel transport system substrate-binding protein
MHRRSFLISASALLALGGISPARSEQGKTAISVGVSVSDIGQLDPHLAVGTPDRVACSWIFNGLVRFKPGTIDPAQIEPDIAESWENNADKTVWTFHLRQGVRFHGDYGELTADDVVFSINKASKAESSAFSGDFSAFRSVTAVDPKTVRVELAHPIPSLLGVLTNYSGGFIISKKAYEERKENFTRSPIGTGPFAVEKIVAGQSLDMVAHENYFRGAPKLKRITYRFLKADASRDLAYRSGELDLVQGVQDQRWVNRVKKVEGTTVDIFEPAEMQQLYLNMTSAPLDDIKVREAIACAINRDELVKWRGSDICRVAKSIVPSGSLGFTADNGLPKFDLDRARKLLAEAGHPDGVTINVIQTQYPDMLNLMQVVQAQLQRAGIVLNFQLVEHSVFHEQIRKDRSQLVMYSAARFPIADAYLTQFFDSKSIVGTPTGITNFSHSKVADKEIEAARTEADEQKQIELWHKAQRELIAKVPAVPLIETLVVWARRNDFDYGYDLKGAIAGGPILTEKSGYA